MSKNLVKKEFKKFSSFAKEEQWLQKMLQEGWLLESYGYEDEDGCFYTFKRIQNEAQKKLIYKVDFREFDKKEDFEEYNEIFNDAGWTLLSKNNRYSKHILVTESSNSQKSIFSDTHSYIEREKRRMSSSLTTGLISVPVFIIAVILSLIFNKSSIFGAGLLILGTGIYYVIDYFKHRKVYKQLVNNGVKTF